MQIVRTLPAISAKIRQLSERIKVNTRRYNQNGKKFNDGNLGELHDLIEADIHEQLAWRLSAEILSDMLKQPFTMEKRRPK
jgi:hypothetical protein